MLQISETPLVYLENSSKKYSNHIYAKMESLNPTGSHKDRETIAMINDMISIGAKEAAIASTGNAAISLAALAPCAGIEVNVFLSRATSNERLRLISIFGPVIHMVDGTYDDAIRESNLFAETKSVYNANPGHNTHKMSGDSNIGLEISSQMTYRRPDCVVVPSNNGTLISGVWIGIRNEAKPIMVAAVAEKSSIMQSIAGYHRFNGRELDETIEASHGKVVGVTDDEAAESTLELRYEGIFCEPASAASLAAAKKLEMEDKTMVLLITGAALKFPDWYAKALNQRI